MSHGDEVQFRRGIISAQLQTKFVHLNYWPGSEASETPLSVENGKLRDTIKCRREETARDR